jgi:hypothetical protein
MRNRYIQHFSSVGEDELERVKKGCEERGNAEHTRDDVPTISTADAAKELDQLMHGESGDKDKQEGGQHGFLSAVAASLDQLTTTQSGSSVSQLPDELKDYATRVHEAW